MTEAMQDGAMRHAETLLRTAGGRTVLLRMPGMAASGEDAEQLGLATPEFQDIPLRPAVFHKANSTTKLLVSASAILAVVHTLAYDSADVLFETAAGVVIDEVMYEIASSFVSQSGGTPYCYWLVLQVPRR